MHTPEHLEMARAVVRELVAGDAGDAAVPALRPRADRAPWGAILVATGLGAGAIGLAIGFGLGLAVRAPVVVITNAGGG